MSDTIFNVLQAKITISINELVDNHFISDNKDSVQIIKNLADDIVDKSVSAHSMIELITKEPEILLMDLRNMPEIIKVMNGKTPNYLDSLKVFVSRALLNWAIEYLIQKEIFQKDNRGYIVLRD